MKRKLTGRRTDTYDFPRCAKSVITTIKNTWQENLYIFKFVSLHQHHCSVIKLHFLRNYTQGNNGYFRLKDKIYYGK